MQWLKWLWAYLYLCIDDPDPNSDPADDPASNPDDEGNEDPNADDPNADPDDGTVGDPEPEAPPQETRAQRRIRELNERYQASQRELEAERRRNTASQPAPQAPVDRQFEAEEARLRDPGCSDWERWQINSNRTLRANQAQSQQALNLAADMADRTAFLTEAMTDPRMSRYKDRVEARFQELKAKGQGAPRRAIYIYLLGEDVSKAKPKPKAKEVSGETTPKERTPGPTAAQRGRPISARSDMNGKGASTEAEKRRKRLEGVNI